MPRIATSAGVFALIAVSIALNISRYPRVWEMTDRPMTDRPMTDGQMTDGPAHLSQADQQLQTTATAEPATSPDSETAPQPEPFWQTVPPASLGNIGGNVGGNEPEPLTTGEDESAYFAGTEEPFADVLLPPREVPAAAKYASLAGEINAFDESEPNAGLVPVTRPGFEGEVADSLGSGPDVHRLPPVGWNASNAQVRVASQDPIPSYPSTEHPSAAIE